MTGDEEWGLPALECGQPPVSGRSAPGSACSTDSGNASRSDPWTPWTESDRWSRTVLPADVSRPSATSRGRCSSPSRAPSTTSAPVAAGMSGPMTRIWRSIRSRSSARATLESPSSAWRRRRSDLVPCTAAPIVSPTAATVSADFTTVVAMTPSWCLWRPRFQTMSPAPPMRWATIAPVSTGEKRCQDSPSSWSVTAASALPVASVGDSCGSATEPKTLPPNQVARPRSCSDRQASSDLDMRVLLRVSVNGGESCAS